MTSCLGKAVHLFYYACLSCTFINLCVCVCVCVCMCFPFGFEGGMWSLMVLILDHCLSFLL